MNIFLRLARWLVKGIWSAIVTSIAQKASYLQNTRNAMKTKFICALFASLLLSIATINAAGLLNENDLLVSPQKEEPKRVICTSGQQRQLPAVAAHVVVKLFGARGELLSLQRVPMKEFLSGDFTRECLPEGTNFVMYHDNTAYYQTAAGSSSSAGPDAGQRKI